jgi:hypothetical protein
MGIFDFFQSRGNRADNSGDQSDLPKLKRKSISEINAQKSKHEEGFELVEERVEIVGESFYVESFKYLRDQLGVGSDTEVQVEVELVNDPKNPHASNGKAVAAFVMGKKVGHVSSETSEAVFDSIATWSDRVKTKGRIYFGDMRQNPPRNSVSVNYTVVNKIKVSPNREKNYQKTQDKRAIAEAAKEEFLRSPKWSSHTLVDGDSVTFSGFEQHIELPKLASMYLPSEPSSGIHLLVMHPRIIADSAKLRDWLAMSRPVTDLETFLLNNPNFAQHFNRSTGEFDMPETVTGKKKKKLEPPKASRTFESDENHSNLPLASDLVLLPEQTLAKYPTFTRHGSFTARLSDLKNFEDKILALFQEVGGKKTDGILLKGKLSEIQLDGETRLAFQFRGETIALVPKNETTTLIRDGKSWKNYPTISLFLYDFKGGLKGLHDSGLGEGFWRK